MSTVARPTIIRHYVLAALLVITAINYIQRNCIGPAMTTIEVDLNVDGVKLDQAAGAFFLTYTLFQVPSGWLAQRWGPRLTLSLYAAGWSAALLLCAASAGLIELYISRLLMGALQAGIFPCCTLILASWYPAARRGLASALLNSFMLLGTSGGGMLAGSLLEPLGWRGLFVAYALPGFAWAAWFLWWFRDRPERHPSVNPAELALLPPTASPEKPATRPALASVLVVLSLPLLLLYTQQSFRAAANRLFDSRLPTYFERERGMSKERAAVLANVPTLAGVVGGVVGGMLSDWVLRRTGSRRWGRNGVAVGSLAVCIGLYAISYHVADINLAVAVASLGFFVFCFSSPCAYALAIDVGGPRLAVVFGLMNMAGNLGAYLFVSYVTALVNLGGWPLVLAVWLGLHAAALVCWLFLNPNVSLEPTGARSVSDGG